MSFNQIQYINSYSKKNYKTLLIKYRKDSYIFDWMNNKKNKNGYILKLVEQDILNNIYSIDKMINNVKKNINDKELFFGEWLDDFYHNSKSIRQMMIDKEPTYLKNEREFMSYIAASIEFLSNKYKLDKPDWIYKEIYFNESDCYAFNTKNDEYRIFLKNNTPLEFSKRKLFVGNNILKRV